MISAPSITKPPSAAAAFTSSTLPTNTGVKILSFKSSAAASSYAFSLEITVYSFQKHPVKIL